MPTRREFVQNGVTLGAMVGLGATASACASSGTSGSAASGAMSAAGAGTSASHPANPASAIKQSVCRWCFNEMPLDDLAANAKRIGLKSIELLQPADFPTIEKHGLICAMVSQAGTGGIPRGWNRVENHSWLIPAYQERIDVVEIGRAHV